MKENINMIRLALLISVFCLLFFPAQGQPVKVIVAPDRPDWTYRTGDQVRFSVMVLHNGNLLENASVRYEIGKEKMKPSVKDSMQLKKGMVTLDGGTMNEAGFLRCIAVTTVNGKEYRGLATAAFEPLKIKPTVPQPDDFANFWDSAKANLAKIPLDARVTLIPERCTETVNVYHVNLQNYKVGARLYGILSVPKKEGKYPALLRVPGAGVRPYAGDVKLAEKGIITLEIGIHGVPVTMEPAVYTDMAAGWVNAYWTYNLDNRDEFYFKRVFLGCVRANDFLTSLPQYDGKNLAVTGSSQGGALSIVTAALDPRVKALGVFCPALSDLTGYLHGRAGGWPHYFDEARRKFNETPEKINTAAYYDVVNFARLVKAKGLYMWGFNDETCPPTSMYAAYNTVNAPKSLSIYPDTGHWMYPEEHEEMTSWLLGQLKGGS